MLIDFRRKPTTVPDLFIEGVKVERVCENKYLGTIIDNKSNFDVNVSHVNKKCQSRIFCLQKLRNLGINGKILQGFYKCFIESVLTFSNICWFGNLSVKNKNVLNRIVNVCSKVVGVKQEGLNELYERRVMRKAQVILSDKSHCLSKYYELLPSGKRYRSQRFKNVRSKNSFIHKSIFLLNG